MDPNVQNNHRQTKREYRETNVTKTIISKIEHRRKGQDFKL